MTEKPKADTPDKPKNSVLILGKGWVRIDLKPNRMLIPPIGSALRPGPCTSWRTKDEPQDSVIID